MTIVSTMKAAVFEGVKPSAPYLNLKQIPSPIPGNGDVVVKILASRILSYAGEIFNGSRPYPSRFPYVPGSGGVGIVKSIGPGSVHLKVGQMVYIDPSVRARDHPVAPASILQGLIAVGEAQKLQDIWLNGSWAEEMLVPVENVTVIPPSVQSKYTPGQLTSLGNYAVVYGGFLASNFKPGQTVAVTGSTGPFGAAIVAVALAVGARRVIPSGRNETQLNEYATRYGSRVVPVVLTGDETKDAAQFEQAAGEGFSVDLVFDMLPPGAPFTAVRSAVHSLRPGGTAILMGGVQANVDIPYFELMMKNITVKGNLMYTRDAPTTLLGLVDGGLLDLSTVKSKEFKLDDIEEAVQFAAGQKSPYEGTIVTP